MMIDHTHVRTVRNTRTRLRDGTVFWSMFRELANCQHSTLVECPPSMPRTEAANAIRRARRTIRLAVECQRQNIIDEINFLAGYA